MRGDRLPAAGAAYQHIRRLVLVAAVGIGLGADRHPAASDDGGAVLEHLEPPDLEAEGTVDPPAPRHVRELGRLVGPFTVGVDQPKLLGEEPIEKCDVPLAIGARPEHLLDLAQLGLVGRRDRGVRRGADPERAGRPRASATETASLSASGASGSGPPTDLRRPGPRRDSVDKATVRSPRWSCTNRPPGRCMPNDDSASRGPAS